MKNQKACRASGATDTYSDRYERSTFQYGIETYKDPKVLRTLYHEEGLSQADIAYSFNVTQQTVSHWMRKFDIETRPPMDERDRSVSKSQHPKAKVQYHVPDGGGGVERFYRHQLVALLEFEASEVFANDTHVHHEMGSPVVVDVPENLDVIGDAAHVRAHAGGAACIHPDIVLIEMRDDVEDETDHVELKPRQCERDGSNIEGTAD
jgi:hypothetical protein